MPPLALTSSIFDKILVKVSSWGARKPQAYLYLLVQLDRASFLQQDNPLHEYMIFPLI